MKWNEMTVLRKFALVLSAVCCVSGFTLTILHAANILENVELLEDILDCIFWLFFGIAVWKKGSHLPFICLLGAALNFFFIFV